MFDSKCHVHIYCQTIVKHTTGMTHIRIVFCVFPLCCNFCVFVGFQSRVRVNSVKYFLNSLAPFTERCPNRKIQSTTLHKTPPYRAQSCISIHPGKEEDTNKRNRKRNRINARQWTPIKTSKTVSNIQNPVNLHAKTSTAVSKRY